MEYEPGDVLINRYEVVKVKKGGFGVVYISRDLMSGVGIAIKSFQDQFFTKGEVARAFYHEAEVWIKLGVHENIVTALQVLTVDEKPHIWLEYVDGGSLRDWMREGRLDTVRSLQLAMQFCEGMIHANSVDLGGGKRGIVHRDIDPGNILMTKEGLLKITDFGLVKALGEEPLRTAGKPPYMSPEQFSGADLDARSDVYSFGVVLYEMLVGRPPFHNPRWGGQSYAHHHLHEAPVPPREMDPSIPPELDALVLKCLEKRMEARYQAFEDIKRDLERIDREVFEERAQEMVIPRLALDSKLLVVPRVEALILKGFSLESLGELQGALECFDTALKLDPSEALAWTGKGIVLKDLKQYGDAIKCFDEALRIQPENSIALTHKGLALHWMEKPREAMVYFDKALEVDPEDSDAWNGKGVSFMDLGNMRDAIRCLQRAIELKPSNADAWYNLGVISFRDGDYTRALELFEAVLKIDPRRADARNTRGGCLFYLGRVEEALKAFESALEVDPDNEMYKANLEGALRFLRQQRER